MKPISDWISGVGGWLQAGPLTLHAEGGPEPSSSINPSCRTKRTVCA